MKIAIIGSGFGGLAAAIRLQAAGHDTTIYEARDKPGGRAYVYEQDGFVFDGGPTVITAPHCFDELFELVGRRRDDYVEFLPVHPYYRLLWEDGTHFDYDGEIMAAEIERLAPSDLDGYRRFVDYSRRVFEAGYTKLAAHPFLHLWDMVRVSPQLASLRADRSVYATVSRFVRDEHLRQALSFHSLLVGGNPFETSSIYTLIHYLERNWGVYFPRGGTGALVHALLRLHAELGGRILLANPVEQVRLERSANGQTRHRLLDAQGGDESFDAVVSNADLHHTYAQLYGGSSQGQRMRKRLEGMQWSMSLFVLYFGTSRLYRPQIAHHSILFAARYRELLQEIFHGHELPRDFSLYLHAPTVTDPSLAPHGHEGFYVLAPVPHLGHAPIDWGQEGERYADRILAYLERTLPDLRSQVVTRHWIDPAHFRDTLRSHLGSAFSCAPTLRQSAWFRPHNRDPRIPGLYLVGAGTHPGAGLPGVVNSAKATAGVMLEDFAR